MPYDEGRTMRMEQVYFYKHPQISVAIFINVVCQLIISWCKQADIIIYYMNTISLERPDDLELGEIPNNTIVNVPTHVTPSNRVNTTTHVNSTPRAEMKTIKLNSPLQRLFFDPNKIASNSEHDQAQIDNGSALQIQRNRTQSSHSQDSSSSHHRGQDRSRSRDQKNHRMIDQNNNDKNKRKNRRQPKKNQTSNDGVLKPQNKSQSEVHRPDSFHLNKIHQQTRGSEQKIPTKENKDNVLIVKQSYDGINSQKLQERSGGVKLNNTNFDRFFKTRICPQFEEGYCQRNSRCTYAHGQKELRDIQSAKNPTYKTKICNNFEKGLCHKKKQQCAYAHGKDDLRIFELNARNQMRIIKNQEHSRGYNSDRNKNQERLPSQNGNSRQNKIDKDQIRRNIQGAKTQNKPEKDINEKYALSERQQYLSNERTPNSQTSRNFDYSEELNGMNGGSEVAYSAAMHKNMMGNNFMGGYFPAGVPFLQGQPPMQGYPPYPEGYPNYYFPYYPCYPMASQPQMNFYPAFANFPAQTSNSSAFNSSKTNFEYVNDSNTNSNPLNNGFHGNRGDKRQNNRHRGSRNEQQPAPNY